MSDHPVLAAIDCGTNSTRLLVAAPDGTALARMMTITRLGRGVDRSGRLDPEGMAATVAVLREYRSVMDSHRVDRVRMTATSAARDAANREEFFDAAEAAVGTRPELISGEEEGGLSFAGATAQLDCQSGPWLVVDIGGGSTELAAGATPGGKPWATRSLDVGCVRITERFLSEEPPAEESIAAARRYCRELLTGAAAELPGFDRPATFVGLAGTVACLASIDQGLTAYDRERVHHHLLGAERVAEILARLASMTAAERLGLAGVEAARADVIVGGTIVLAEVMRCFGFDSCLTSEADILDGLVASIR